MEPVPETRAALESLTHYGDAQSAVALLTMGRRALEIVPELIGLSLALIDDGITLTLVASDIEAQMLDAAQYLDGGPCIDAVESETVLDVNQSDLLDEDRWLVYARSSAATGVASSLSLPIQRKGRVVGGLNMYASTAGAFNGRHEALAEALGASAADAVANADLTFSSRLKAAQAPATLAEQRDVDLAVGIIAATHDVDVLVARDRLKAASARAGITEAQAAQTLRHIRAP